MDDTAIGLWGVPLAILAGAIRVSTPFIFVSLGETITERSGRRRHRDPREPHAAPRAEHQQRRRRAPPRDAAGRRRHALQARRDSACGQRGSARREPGSRARGLDDLLKRLSITTIVRSFASCGGPFCARDQRKGVLRNHLYTGKISYKMTFWLRKWYTVIVQRMGFFQQTCQGEFCRG